MPVPKTPHIKQDDTASRSDPSASTSAKRKVGLLIAGRQFHVTTSASDEQIARLASVVDRRTREILGKRAVDPETFVLTALALAHDLETERDRLRALRGTAKGSVGTLREQVDAAFRRARGTSGG
jgi:cell division protein ZapA